MKQHDRLGRVRQIEADIQAGKPEDIACMAARVTPACYRKWKARLEAGGPAALADAPRSGRPAAAPVTEEDAKCLGSAYLRSNRGRGAGSMRAAARWAAREGGLNPELAAACLAGRPPSPARRAMRQAAPDAAIARYRDPDAGLDDGLYAPGWLRMAGDGSRRLLPGERQCWDDATVNVGVAVPWPRGGDRCSDRFGWRLGRFQLLAGIDCATDFCPGYRFTIRGNDAYNSADIAAAMLAVWGAAGRAPRQCVLEGGGWQAGRTLELLRAQGVAPISAKGRPNQKLIEGWFSRLWTEMSLDTGLCRGQVGRFRGEMGREKALWTACREGREDPRAHFPELPDFLAGLNRCVGRLNASRVESGIYGSWTPIEAYAGAEANAMPLLPGLWRYAAPVRCERTLRRGGMCAVRAESPFGWPWLYFFAAPEGWRWDGARVTVSFDPAEVGKGRGAHLELAAPWRDLPAGTEVAADAPLAGPAPDAGTARWHDPRAVMRQIKSAGRAATAAAVAAFDGRGGSVTRTIHAAAAAEEDAEAAAPAFARRERAAPTWEEALAIAAG